MKSADPNDGKPRCKWAATDAMLAAYHDHEWGRPIRTDAGHLERMALEIFQCGLSWKIVLVKRPALRAAFHKFDLQRVAGLTTRDVQRLCNDASIIRNRRKIEATIFNARRFIELAAEHRSYRRWLGGLPLDDPSARPAIHQAFRSHFKFMGPETITCYLMGCGLIPPAHEAHCWASGS